MAVIKAMEDYGSLKGRYNSNWQPSSRWRCLTGEAQIAVVIYRLAGWYPEYGHLLKVADRILVELARTQDIDSPYTDIHGAVAGSYPIWGHIVGSVIRIGQRNFF